MKNFSDIADFVQFSIKIYKISNKQKKTLKLNYITAINNRKLNLCKIKYKILLENNQFWQILKIFNLEINPILFLKNENKFCIYIYFLFNTYINIIFLL